MKQISFLFGTLANRCNRASRVTLALAMGMLGTSHAEPLQLRAPVTVIPTSLFSGNQYAIPCVTDWNGDGKKDLLVGYRTADKIALFLNTGTDANPVFTSYTNLKTNGVDIVVPGSSCGAPAPWVCDFDGDGKRDLLVGSGANGSVTFFRNTNTDAAPLLAPGVLLKVGTTDLSVSARATPYVHDWDEDGLDDLLCGCANGYIYFFQNTNTAQNPIFAAGVQLQAGGTILVVDFRSVARVFDWDGDGLKDLVLSSANGVYWCRNTNSNAHPILQGKAALQAPASGTLANINSSSRMRLDLVDWNDDGVMDLILGNADGTVFLYEGYHFKFSAALGLPSGAVALGWNSASSLKYNLWGGDTLTDLTESVASNILSQGATTWYTNAATGSCKYYRVQISP